MLQLKFYRSARVSWSSLVQTERHKNGRWLIRNAASKGLGMATILLCLYLGFAESIGKSERWSEVDKSMHFLVFGCFSLAFLQYARLKLFTQMGPWPRILILFAILGAICALGEAVHLLIPSRTFEWNDMIANALGTIVFGAPYVLLVPFKQIISHEHMMLKKNTAQLKNQRIRLRKRSTKLNP